jgi:hypothetical protein
MRQVFSISSISIFGFITPASFSIVAQEERSPACHTKPTWQRMRPTFNRAKIAEILET